MAEITLINSTKNGEQLKAVYSPHRGMNLISFSKGSIDVIDQSTKPLFEERCAGLGSLIGPHFHRRRFETLPSRLQRHAAPEIENLRKNNPQSDPFSHGIGRYAAWQYEQTPNSISAILKGSDLWNEIPLKELEGQDFTLKYNASLTSSQLQIELSVVSETDSLIGIHYYYHLPQGKGIIKSKVKDTYIAELQKLPIPNTWNYDRHTHELIYELNQDTDFTFRPSQDPTKGTILLEAETYQLKTHFSANSEECSWQLWHPKEASFVCIEPISSQDPRHPNLTVSSLKINLEIN